MDIVGGIYQIRNRISGKRYIGSAVNFKKRWRAHLWALRHGQHRNRHLQRAFDKRGESAFVFSVLEHVEDTLRLILREQYFFDMLSPEYNISPTAGSTLGVSCSAETKRKHSEVHKGKRHSAETRRKISEGNRGRRSGMYGKHHSAETRAKMSAAWTPERRQKQSAHLKATRGGKQHPLYGKRPSVETRAKISAALRGHPVSVETRARISAAHKGQVS